MSAAEYESHYPREPLEWCDKKGAEALACKVAAAWPGHRIEFKHVRVAFSKGLRSARFDLRSDMVNGLPRALYEAIRRQESHAGRRLRAVPR